MLTYILRKSVSVELRTSSPGSVSVATTLPCLSVCPPSSDVVDPGNTVIFPFPLCVFAAYLCVCSQFTNLTGGTEERNWRALPVIWAVGVIQLSIGFLAYLFCSTSFCFCRPLFFSFFFLISPPLWIFWTPSYSLSDHQHGVLGHHGLRSITQSITQSVSQSVSRSVKWSVVRVISQSIFLEKNLVSIGHELFPFRSFGFRSCLNYGFLSFIFCVCLSSSARQTYFLCMGHPPALLPYPSKNLRDQREDELGMLLSHSVLHSVRQSCGIVERLKEESSSADNMWMLVLSLIPFFGFFFFIFFLFFF